MTNEKRKKDKKNDGQAGNHPKFLFSVPISPNPLVSEPLRLCGNFLIEAE